VFQNVRKVHVSGDGSRGKVSEKGRYFFTGREKVPITTRTYEEILNLSTKKRAHILGHHDQVQPRSGERRSQEREDQFQTGRECK